MEPNSNIGRVFGRLTVVGHKRGKDSKGWSTVIYELSCSECSIDSELFPEGSITSSLSNLVLGQIPCGCSKSRHWSVEQRLVIAKRLTSERGFKFIGMEESASSKAKITVECKIGHRWKITTSNLKLRSCPSCARNGFNPEKSCVLYVLRAVHDSGEGFCGYGITSDIETRLKAHKTALAKKQFCIGEMEKFYFNSGFEARDLEYKIKRLFPVVVTGVKGFMTEATAYHNYYDVISFIESVDNHGSFC